MSKKVEISVLTLLFIFTIYSALATGGSFDEPYEMIMGKDRLKYLFSFGSYEYIHRPQAELYPAFYATLAIFVTKMFPIKYEIEVWRLLHVTFNILGPVGDIVEEWTLKGAWVQNANFGDLSFDEGATAVEITCTLRFDYAILQF